MPDPQTAGIRPIWLASYPRSGNTFLRIILQNMFGLPSFSIYRTEGQDFHDPSADALEEAPFLPRNWRETISPAPEARTILVKTHGPPPDDGKAIVLVRDGRAAIDSYFHYHKKFSFEQPSLTEVIAGVCQFGGWSGHYRAWQPRLRPNTLLVKYEELVSRPTDFLPALSEFIGLEPVEGRLPTFAELKERQPAFFRRGKNEDFLREWTPGQLALFSLLHGPVMEELGYEFAHETQAAAGMVKELAESAARSHELYVEQLQKEGVAAAVRQQLAQEVTRLSDNVRDLSQTVAHKDQVLRPLLKSPWVRLGMAVRVVKKARNGDN